MTLVTRLTSARLCPRHPCRHGKKIFVLIIFLSCQQALSNMCLDHLWWSLQCNVLRPDACLGLRRARGVRIARHSHLLDRSFSVWWFHWTKSGECPHGSARSSVTRLRVIGWADGCDELWRKLVGTDQRCVYLSLFSLTLERRMCSLRSRQLASIRRLRKQFWEGQCVGCVMTVLTTSVLCGRSGDAHE